MSKTLYVPSTKGGKSWALVCFKPQGRPAQASATEGTVKVEGSWESFTFIMFQDPIVREPIEGAATLKKKKASLHALLHKLVSAGSVNPEDALPTHAKIDAAPVL